tara:strand:+ start:38652 stop:38846 length:195 start_codon:yes stop_codon:yes gene_type:complete
MHGKPRTRFDDQCQSCTLAPPFFYRSDGVKWKPQTQSEPAGIRPVEHVTQRVRGQVPADLEGDG